MIFNQTSIKGLYEVVIQRHADDRGSFGRTFCRDEFTEQGLTADFVQSSASVTARARTLRGMHFQRSPYEEVKLVRCVRGSIYDVIVDLREDSSSFKQWAAFDLSASSGNMLYVPVGCAHGFLTLTDDVEVIYSMSTKYEPSASAGFRYDDPEIDISWPATPDVIAAKDLEWPSLRKGS